MKDLENHLPAAVPIGSAAGFLAVYCANLAYKMNNPIAGISSAVFTYITAESVNNLAGGKPLYLTAASAIKKGFSKLRI